jgi:serine/threonine protein kinase
MKQKIKEKYVIKNKIGNGNFSVVYIGSNKEDSNQLVAIKIMNTHLNIGIK